ncbi:hypothetical protein MW887_005777 [Aspergillus wentii]|nr:hypothetical protein MW887_005777 [Aspergillus wentii]
MFTKATALLACLATLAPSAMASSPYFGYGKWIEVYTGSQAYEKGALPGPSAEDPDVIRTRLAHLNSCAVSSFNTSAETHYFPPVNVTTGSVPCKKGTFMSADSPELGPFIINFRSEGECPGPSKNCEPLLTINGKNFPMWKSDKNCRQETINGTKGYEVYRCGFNYNP